MRVKQNFYHVSSVQECNGSLHHQMTHVKNYSIGFWDITNFLNIFAASNDTCMDKHILEPFTASNDTCKELFKRVLGHKQFS